MRKILSILLDVSCGIVFLLIALLSARVLLQSARLVYLSLPLLITASLIAGYWRGRSGRSPLLIAAMTTLPLLILTLAFFSGRDKPFIWFPVVTFIFADIGATFAKERASKALLVGLAVVANVGGAVAGPPFVSLMVPSRDVTERAVPFAIHLVDGSTVSSRDLRGKVVVLDFWATWCVPCQHELPRIQQAYEKMRGKGMVAFYAVDGVMTDSPGDSGDTVERASAYFRQHGITIPLAWDGGGVLERAFGVAGYPTLLVLDRQGRVRMRHVGFIGSEDLETTLAKKVAELQNERAD